MMMWQPAQAKISAAIVKEHEERKKYIKKASERQVGGDHYKDLPIQPSKYIRANKLGWYEGNVIKYITRWEKKGGVEDLEKVIHYVELIKEELNE